jgi:ORF6N domain
VTKTPDLVKPATVAGSIRLLRGEKVILDADLADLYGVATRVLVQAVKRNLERFPDDFMFQLTVEEFAVLRSQSVTSRGWGGRRYPPYAFTEQGVAMLAGVLNSPRAVQVNIEIMRAFVRMRLMLASHAKLEKKLLELEEKYDGQFAMVFEALKQLMAPPEPRRKRIGFRGETK